MSAPKKGSRQARRLVTWLLERTGDGECDSAKQRSAKPATSGNGLGSFLKNGAPAT
jgi:hypothetical protein